MNEFEKKLFEYAVANYPHQTLAEMLNGLGKNIIAFHWKDNHSPQINEESVEYLSEFKFLLSDGLEIVVTRKGKEKTLSFSYEYVVKKSARPGSL